MSGNKELVSKREQQSIFAETFSKLFKENTENNIFDRFSSLSPKGKILAVSAVGVIFGAALPILAVALPVAATGAIVALTLFFAYKAVEYTFKGLEWSAEKTVEGAKYIRGKIKDGAVHAKDKVGEGVDSLKKRFKERDRVVFYNHAKEGAAIEKMTKFPEKDRKKAGEIKHELKAIFADKGDNSKLVKNILSGISLKIDLKIAEEAKSESREHTPKWQVQKDFIKHLGEKDLRVLIKQKALPSDVYFIDCVFSEHHDEIKEVIKECKESHLYSSVSNMFNKAEKRANRPSFKSLTRSISSSLSSLGRKDSTQSTSSLSRSSSLNSVKTDSTVSSEAELLNPAEHKEVKAPTSLRNKLSSWLGGKKAPEETTNVKYQDLSGPDTSPRQVEQSISYVASPRSNLPNSIGTESTATVSSSGSKDFATVRRSNSSNSLNASPKLTPVAPPKPPRSPSIDSAIGSGSSTPRGQELNRGLDEATKELDLAASQLPSAKVGESSIHHPAGMKVKAN